MKKLLYIVYIPLLLVEWALAAGVEIVKIIHKSFETLTLAIENTINEPTRKEDSTN